ncbi:5-carboxymethyl-2-hydroxymuconate semialdehyde dehydrogenase [uncultured Tateyamaria sp.]|uniref:5-carboxymethyl-2-hydroxymuconate semialdehyde dehydrogenase n=1 Tax=uncultured Tateyamaria sp. TaxID=455651 RepID=UPI00262DB56E|nr:5-carboxymethyl-2-hydroxymuconate semialdehyde dehydrogenase [uncultured Tateyamaria sp.]
MTNLATHLAKLRPHLDDVAARGLLNHIGGAAVGGVADRWFDATSPVDGSVIARTVRSDAADVDRAAQAARAAFGAWRDMPATERKAILHAIADGIAARADDIALCECWDTGQPWRYMARAALRGAENFRFFADRVASARDGQAMPSPGLMNITTRVPIGPVGVITPWNTPFMLSTWKIAPALAAGCTVVHKPAELSPWTARILIDIAEAAGLPPGVWNLINGTGPEAGRALTEHADIKAIAFVGASQTGAAIMAQGAPTLKRIQFELGGKNPMIIFADADLEAALDATLFMSFALNGERCTASSRLLVQAGIADRFEAALAARMDAIRVGHPLDPATEVGPLISADHAARVRSWIETGQREGAQHRVGRAEGQYIAPTLLTGARNDMRVAQNEIFGPVLTSIRFETEDEALQLANDSAYGLTGYVWTADATRALRVSERLEAGMVWVNTANLRHLPTPFGGMKSSGIGRDGGDWSLEFYMEQKHIGLGTRDPDVPRLGVGA